MAGKIDFGASFAESNGEDTLDKLIVAFAEMEPAVREEVLQSYVADGTFTEEDVSEIKAIIEELDNADALADDEENRDGLSLEAVDAMADADAAKTPFKLDEVDRMADAASRTTSAAVNTAAAMSKDDSTPVDVKTTDKDKDGDIDKVEIKKIKSKKDTAAKSNDADAESATETDNSEASDTPHDEKETENKTNSFARLLSEHRFG